MTYSEIYHILDHAGFEKEHGGFRFRHYMPNGYSNYYTFVSAESFCEFMEIPLELMPKYLEPCFPDMMPFILVSDGKGFTYVAPKIAAARLELGI